jgi:uncharacterized membrane protein
VVAEEQGPLAGRLRSAAQRERVPALAPAVLAGAGFLVAWGLLHWGFYTRDPLRDTPLYEHYGDLVLRGRVPYRDFHVEYPPGALAVFVLPALAAGRHHSLVFSEVFEGLMGLFGVLCAALVALVLTRRGVAGRRLWLALALVALGPLALGPVLLSRFDLWPAALAIGGLAALVYARPRLALVLLGLAVAAKIYAVVLVPLALVFVARHHGRREACVAGGTGAAALAAVVAPFVVLSPQGMWSSLSGQLERPLQIESLGASILLVAHKLAGVPLAHDWSHGSNNLVGVAAHRLALEQSLLQLAVIAAIWIAFARGPADVDRLFVASAACVCAFVALGKVLSPQYLAWLLPLVPLVRGRRGLAAMALLLVALLLTQGWFPYRYFGLVDGTDSLAVALVFARDLILLGLVVVLAWPAATRARATA